jgi:pyruvate formate lyase activating enzyme
MIRAMIETSFVDWDGKLTTVLFVDKCNFMCPFCQNWDLLLHPEKFCRIEWDLIEKNLLSKKSWIDGVVLTGGEPLVYHNEVFDITRRIKELGFLVKIDTNGAYPEILQSLIDENLVDYVAMDIKASLDDRYDRAAGKKTDVEKIRHSIDILMKNKVEYEFRTTCVPGIIDEQTIAEIGEVISGAKRWFLQQYVPENAYKEEYRNLRAVSKLEADVMLKTARNYVSNVQWRGNLT